MSDVFDVIRQIEALSSVPDEQIRWMIDRSGMKELAPGEALFGKGTPSINLYIVISGRIRVWFDQNGETREVTRIIPGEITGLLPYSRMKEASGYGNALEQSQVLALHKDHFPEMIRENYELTEALVYVMTSRIRNFTTMQQQNEKLMSLGKLSAGLAHELNNPAAAVVRSATELKKHLSNLPRDFKRVISMRLEPEQVDTVNNMLFNHLGGEPAPRLSLMERTRREDEICDWLEDHGMGEEIGDISETFVEFGFRAGDLDKVLDQVSDRELEPVLRWLNQVLTTEKLINEIQEASRRISDLVGSVKAYSHMDVSKDRQLVDIRDGIRNTATMLRHKFKKNQVEMVEIFSDDLPLISAYPGELNQVWTNLMDNALDAMENGGTLEISAREDGPCVEVKITDSGKGIPADILNRIWDPFFTTKGIGQGTGLGLDVVQKILFQHRATVNVSSAPGRTEFRMMFPKE